MIISASRRTDLPAFYSDWFLNRLKDGYVLVRNPFNPKQVSKIVLFPDTVECIVFWTKNPEPILSKLKLIDELGYTYYFQYTVTAYDASIEMQVPAIDDRIASFVSLSKILGAERVVWRYDPIFFSSDYTVEHHLDWFEYLAARLQGATDKCTISFLDMYRKSKQNMKGIDVIDLSANEQVGFLKSLKTLAEKHSIQLVTCAEEDKYASIGIQSGKCIDNELISRITGFTVSSKKDAGQRPACGCIPSIDIGAYNTCGHGCVYCYANSNHKKALKDLEEHDPSSPLPGGKLRGDEKITLRKMKP